jgi:hypothetical protein
MRVAANGDGKIGIPACEPEIIDVDGLICVFKRPAQEDKRNLESGDMLFVRAKCRDGFTQSSPQPSVATYERIVIPIFEEKQDIFADDGLRS